jgi:hypothetical protein
VADRLMSSRSPAEIRTEPAPAAAELPFAERQRLARQRRLRRRQELAIRTAVWGLGVTAVLLVALGQLIYIVGSR